MQSGHVTIQISKPARGRKLAIMLGGGVSAELPRNPRRRVRCATRVVYTFASRPTTAAAMASQKNLGIFLQVRAPSVPWVGGADYESCVDQESSILFGMKSRFRSFCPLIAMERDCN